MKRHRRQDRSRKERGLGCKLSVVVAGYREKRRANVRRMVAWGDRERGKVERRARRLNEQR
jgi:hypothetical protein